MRRSNGFATAYLSTDRFITSDVCAFTLRPSGMVTSTELPLATQICRSNRLKAQESIGIVSLQADSGAPITTEISRRPSLVADPTKQFPAGRV